MTSLTYKVYMRSPLWRARRWLWYWLSNRRCERCGCSLILHATQGERGWPHSIASARPRLTGRVLTVHHKTYARLGHERRADVQLLCWPCHCRADSWRRAR